MWSNQSNVLFLDLLFVLSVKTYLKPPGLSTLNQISLRFNFFIITDAKITETLSVSKIVFWMNARNLGSGNNLCSFIHWFKNYYYYLFLFSK